MLLPQLLAVHTSPQKRPPVNQGRKQEIYPYYFPTKKEEK